MKRSCLCAMCIVLFIVGNVYSNNNNYSCTTTCLIVRPTDNDVIGNSLKTLQKNINDDNIVVGLTEGKVFIILKS